MAYTDVRLATVMTRLIARLQTSLSGTDANVFLVDDRRRLPLSPPGIPTYAVSFAGAEFDEGMFDGGGRNQLVANPATVYVSIWSRVQRDEEGHAGIKLTDATEGLLTLCHNVLDSLAGHMLLDGSGNEILREPIIPGGIEEPADMSRDLSVIHLRFRLAHDWLFS